MKKMFVFRFMVLSSVTLYSAEPNNTGTLPVQRQVGEIDFDELSDNKPQSPVTGQPAPQEEIQAATSPSKASFFSQKGALTSSRKKKNVRPRKTYRSYCPSTKDCCSCLNTGSEATANVIDVHNQLQEARSHNNCSRTESADNDQSCTKCSCDCPHFSCPSCSGSCGSV